MTMDLVQSEIIRARPTSPVAGPVVVIIDRSFGA